MAQLRNSLLPFVFDTRTDAPSECDISVEGGDFACEADRNGGFLFVSDGGRVNITGGLVSNNVAGRKGGAVSSRWSLLLAMLVFFFCGPKLRVESSRTGDGAKHGQPSIWS